jgi:hypothetical protein
MDASVDVAEPYAGFAFAGGSLVTEIAAVAPLLRERE